MLADVFHEVAADELAVAQIDRDVAVLSSDGQDCMRDRHTATVISKHQLSTIFPERTVDKW